MGDIYRVSVTRVEPASGDETAVVDLTAPADVLREIAGFAVSRALGISEPAEGGTHEAPQANTEYLIGATAQPKPRKRRTKAEMEAARAAEQAQTEDPREANGAEDTTLPASAAAAAGLTSPVPATAPVSAYNPFG